MPLRDCNLHDGNCRPASTFEVQDLCAQGLQGAVQSANKTQEEILLPVLRSSGIGAKESKESDERRSQCRSISVVESIGTSSCGTGKWCGSRPVKPIKIQPVRWRGLTGHPWPREKSAFGSGKKLPLSRSFVVIAWSRGQ